VKKKSFELLNTLAIILCNTIVSKHIIVNMLELLNALDNSSIGNDAKIIRFMVFKTKQSKVTCQPNLV
jgi:hypothetical protein